MPNNKIKNYSTLVKVLIVLSLLTSCLPFFPIPTETITGFSTFLGRFHPLILHFPIALILLAVGMEAFNFFNKKEKLLNTNKQFFILLLLAGVSCFFTVLIGFLLYRSGEYQGEIIRQHLWGGVVLNLCLSAAIYFYWKWQNHQEILPYRLYQLGLFGAGLITIYTSHLGGSITHGPNFLIEHSPNLFSTGKSEIENKKPEALLVYNDLVRPALENRCFSCHNSHKQKGGLLLTSLANIQKGGKSGKPMLVANSPEKSELYHRLVLPDNHEDRMPPKEKIPLAADEITLIHWWIQEGAKEDMVIGIEPPDSIAALLQRYLPNLYRSQRLKIQQEKEVAELTKELADFGENIGLVIERDKEVEGLFFAVSVPMPPTLVDNRTIAKLLPYKELFSKVSLPGTEITDDALYDLGRMPNLQALFLNNTGIKGEGLIYLKPLTQLKLLNLSHSYLSNAGILHLNQLPSLKECYIFDTKVEPTIIEALQQHLPNLKLKIEEGPFF